VFNVFARNSTVIRVFPRIHRACLETRTTFSDGEDISFFSTMLQLAPILTIHVKYNVWHAAFKQKETG
jgi:hypothetical protein